MDLIQHPGTATVPYDIGPTDPVRTTILLVNYIFPHFIALLLCAAVRSQWV